MSKSNVERGSKCTSTRHISISFTQRLLRFCLKTPSPITNRNQPDLWTQTMSGFKWFASSFLWGNELLKVHVFTYWCPRKEYSSTWWSVNLSWYPHGKRPGIPWSFWHPKPRPRFFSKTLHAFALVTILVSMQVSSWEPQLVLAWAFQPDSWTSGYISSLYPPCTTASPVAKDAHCLHVRFCQTKLPLETTHAPRHASPSIKMENCADILELRPQKISAQMLDLLAKYRRLRKLVPFDVFVLK